MRALVFPDSEVEVWVSICLEHDIVSQGTSRHEALIALDDAIGLCLEWEGGTLKRYPPAPDSYAQLWGTGTTYSFGGRHFDFEHTVLREGPREDT